jgi:hypothetical protein
MFRPVDRFLYNLFYIVIRTVFQVGDELTNDKVPLIIGGRSAKSYDRIMKEINAVVVSDLADLRDKLNIIGK